MRPLIADKHLIAYCGLYCGACKKYLAEKCFGCKRNTAATWCKVRVCGIERNYHSCAECTTFVESAKCKKFNNVISKIFSLIFGSSRIACIREIKKLGNEQYAKLMADHKAVAVKK
jgi:hypothetical protein